MGLAVLVPGDGVLDVLLVFVGGAVEAAGALAVTGLGGGGGGVLVGTVGLVCGGA